MTRLIVLGLLLLILRLAWKSFAIQIKAQVSGLSPGGRPSPPAPHVETLVRCARCGTYVTASRALKAKGAEEEAFCSEECRGAGAKPA